VAFPFSISHILTVSSNDDVARKPGTVELKHKPKYSN
jgi:hypothetical protein